MGAALRLPDTVVRPVDPRRRPVEIHQRPAAPRASRPHSCGQVAPKILTGRFSMSRHSANQTHFNPRLRPPSRRFDAGNNTVRVVLVAIHHGPQPAAFLGSHPLQRLQVLLAAPGEEIEFDPLNTIARAAAGAPPQLLPQMPATNGSLALRPRLVQGEILSDDDGRLYEKIGRRIRPLQRLFSGRRGEVLELPAEALTEHLVTEQTPQAAAEASKPEAQAETRADAPAER